MRAVNLNTQIRNFFLSILAILMMFGFNSCTKKATAVTTPIVPEERGQLQVKRDVNSNYVIQINISDLEPVKKLIPAKEAYVVWMVTDMKATKNLGQIEGANTWDVYARVRPIFHSHSEHQEKKKKFPLVFFQ